jgi:hypothetical protein
MAVPVGFELPGDHCRDRPGHVNALFFSAFGLLQRT